MSETGEPTVEIADHREAGRYELRHDGDVVGWVQYRISDGVMTIPHVEVLHHLRGRGHSEPFLSEVLADVQRRGLKVVPLCGYAATHIRSRPELTHLLA